MFRSSLQARFSTIVAVGTVLAVLAGCSGGGSSAKPRSPAPTPRASGNVEVPVGTVTVTSAGGEVPLPDADRDAITGLISTYINTATVKPLTSSKPDAGQAALAALFTADAAPAVTGPEHDALADSGIGPVTGSITTEVAPVAITGLADKLGGIDLIGTTLNLTVKAKAKNGPIVIRRAGELMFTRDGTTWRLLGFKLAVTREGTGLETVTSSTTGGPTP